MREGVTAANFVAHPSRTHVRAHPPHKVWDASPPASAVRLCGAATQDHVQAPAATIMPVVCGPAGAALLREVCALHATALHNLTSCQANIYPRSLALY